jgi:hypothetical protein
MTARQPVSDVDKLKRESVGQIEQLGFGLFTHLWQA